MRNSTDAAKLVGRNVHRIRRSRGMTQEELARQLGPHIGATWRETSMRQLMSAAEKGGRAWTAAELLALTEILEVPISELFDPTPPPPTCPACGQELPDE